MTRKSNKIACAIGAAALGCTGFALAAAPATAAPAASASMVASTPASAPSTTPPTAAACDRTPWEAKVQGTNAKFGAGSPSGDYLWHNTHGFRLRVTHGGSHDQRIYSGVIHSSAAMRVDPVKLEKGDTLKLSANRETLVFVFANHGLIDGVNFHTDCATRLTVSRLHIGSRDLPTSRVFLGATAAHPAQVPFTVHRLKASTT